MTTKQVSVRMAAVGGKQVKAELIEIGAAGSRSFDQLDRSARVGGGGLQNLGFQVQDFAVQVGAGTSATQALAQQLPQLLSGFGLLGVAIGTASAVAIPLLSMAFGNLREEVLSVDEAVKGLEASTDALRSASEAFSASGLGGLAEKYGEVSAAVLLLTQRQVNLAAEQAKEAAAAAAIAFSAEFDGVLQSRRANIADFLGLELGFVNTKQQVEEVLPAIAEFEQALVNIGQATSFEDQADALAAMLVILDQTEAKGGEFYQQMLSAEAATRAAAAAGGGVNSWLDAAISGAGDLAGQLWEAARAAFSVGQNQAAGAAQPAVGGDRLAQAYATYGATRMAADDPIWALPAAPARRGGGGARRSGGGGGRGGVSDDAREAARIFEETRTEAEKYATQLERLNELKAGGLLSDDTFARAMENLRDKTGETSNAMKDLESSVGDAFTSFVTGAKSGQEALSDLLSSLANTLANQAFQAISGSIFGGGGGLFSGIFGGGRAGGGPVLAGRSYMVGESGPEMITMGGGGYVTNTAALRSAVAGGGGGVVFNVDARGAVEGVAEQIQRAIAAAAPAIVRASVQANRGAAARGM